MAAVKDIAIYGAGGFGREVACLINRINEVEPTWNLVGFFDDDTSLKGTRNEYGEVLGDSEVLNSFEGDLAVAVSVGSPIAIQAIVERITKDVLFPNLIDPDVTFFDKKNVVLGEGNIILAKCLISTNVKFGNFNILNANDGIGHDAVFGNFNCLMPNVNISGGVVIGNGNFFGVKSTVLQYFKIGNNTKLAADSVLMRNARDGFLYMGNPAMKMKL